MHAWGGGAWAACPDAPRPWGVCVFGAAAHAHFPVQPIRATAHLQEALQAVVLAAEKVSLACAVVGADAQCVNVGAWAGAGVWVRR